MARGIIEVNHIDGLIGAWQKQAQQKASKDGVRFLTHSGRLIDFLSFSECDVDLADIAHGLSMACRFAGQCDRFYSVAEHSVLVSRYVERVTNVPGNDLTKTALLHDASEAYLGDVTAPLKMLCPGYEMIERRFQVAIQRAFRLRDGFDHSVVKQCDMRMFYRERDALLPGHAINMRSDKYEHDQLSELLEIQCLPPLEAKKLFLERIEELEISLPS